MRRFGKYLLIMLLPLGVLLVRPIIPATVLAFGEEIRLATEPIDPRDIFRGDYVTLSFSIERLPATLMDETARKKWSDARPVYDDSWWYVRLDPDSGGISQAVTLLVAPPEEGTYIRGHIRYHHSSSDMLEMDYGAHLKRFYVKENTGLELERAAQKGHIEAVAKVWKGRAVLESVKEALR